MDGRELHLVNCHATRWQNELIVVRFATVSSPSKTETSASELPWWY